MVSTAWMLSFKYLSSEKSTLLPNIMMYAYDAQRLINPNRIETNQFCPVAFVYGLGQGVQSYCKLENKQFRINSTRPSFHDELNPRRLVSTSCLVFVLSLLNIQVYKITN